jgi:CheY-like chemotaxis protein
VIIEVEALNKMFAQHSGEECQVYQSECLRCGCNAKVEISRTSGGYGFHGGVLVSAHQDFLILCSDCFRKSDTSNGHRFDSNSLKNRNVASKMEIPLRVIVADDHKEMRKALIQSLDCQRGIQVVGEAANGQEALELSRQLGPNVVVMDVSMPVMNGVEATRRIKAEMPKVRVIGLSMYDDELIKRIMRYAGAEYFMSKAGSLSGLPDAIHNGSR